MRSYHYLTTRFIEHLLANCPEPVGYFPEHVLARAKRNVPEAQVRPGSPDTRECSCPGTEFQRRE